VNVVGSFMSATFTLIGLFIEFRIYLVLWTLFLVLGACIPLLLSSWVTSGYREIFQSAATHLDSTASLVVSVEEPGGDVFCARLLPLLDERTRPADPLDPPRNHHQRSDLQEAMALLSSRNKGFIMWGTREVDFTLVLAILTASMSVVIFLIQEASLSSQKIVAL